MISGTKPLLNPPKRQFHRYFGGVSLAQIPDFNLDAGLWMPDQEADEAPTECTGYTVTDIKADFDKVLYTPDWQYAKTLQLEGVTPTTGGADFHVAMQSAVVFGALKMINMPFSAATKGELFVANIKNWDPTLGLSAVNAAEIGTYNALGMGDDFSSILSAAFINKMGVSIGTPWFPEWENQVGSDGILPMPNLNVDFSTLPWHNWAIKGKKTTDKPRTVGKSWQGTKYGDKGFHYIDQETLNAVMTVTGTGAISFADTGNRILNVLIIILSKTPQGLALLPEVIMALTK
jgi:hypothetical protein